MARNPVAPLPRQVIIRVDPSWPGAIFADRSVLMLISSDSWRRGAEPMPFAQFEESIGSVALKNLARNWNEARGDRTMPDWSDIKPSQISNVLPIIWAYTY